MSTAIKFENISKQYRLGVVSTQTLSHDLNRWWKMNVRGQEDPYLKIGEVNDRAHKGESEYVWALKDINFEVQQGDVLGIIGKNGAGKSTLLKILSKVTAPTTGTIKAAGRIASLLEVGTGFHPEMTGRENIYMNGAIMGMTKAEITRRFDEIVDFSGVERYIDTPAKRYSSGMTVRLGFAIAAHLEPEILVVDEVLAVGDAEFQKKAIGKMQDVSRGEGRTVLFVSHNMDAIRKLCNRCVLLKDGVVNFTGNTNDVIDTYILNNQNSSHKLFDKYISDSIFLKEAVICGEKNLPTNELLIGEKWSVKVKFEIQAEIQNTVFGIGITTATEIPINTTWSSPQNLKCGNYEIDFVSDNLFFQKGVYRIVLGISKGNDSLYYDDDFLQFEVVLISKNINEDLIRVDGTTGIIMNQLRTKIVRI